MSIDKAVVASIRKNRHRKLRYLFYLLGFLTVLVSIPACSLLKEQIALWENTFSSVEECIEAKRSLSNAELYCRLTLKWEIYDPAAPSEPLESGELIF